MTISMTAKHQITIPRKIAAALDLKKGDLFNITVQNNKIELIPLEVKEKYVTAEMYKKLDLLSKNEKGREKKSQKTSLKHLKKGQISAVSSFLPAFVQSQS